MKRNEMDWILLAMTLFEATAFSMLAFYNGFDFVPLILAVSMPLLLIAQIVLLWAGFSAHGPDHAVLRQFLMRAGDHHALPA